MNEEKKMSKRKYCHIFSTFRSNSVQNLTYQPCKVGRI